MSGLWEFFFCPVCGIFRPELWPLIGTAWTWATRQIVAQRAKIR
jgi:hypothetical protein